jgi:hypothetical protein
VWNTALQYQLFPLVWPDVEFNYICYPNGPSHGKHQLFCTPGIVLGRLSIWKRLTLCVGVGYQGALTDEHPPASAQLDTVSSYAVLVLHAESG